MKKKTRKTYARRTRIQKQSNPLTWLVSGILIGLIIPALFFFKSHQKKSEITNIAKIQATTAFQEEEPIKFHKPLKVTPKQKKSPLKADYEFYHLLSSEEESNDFADKISSSRFILHIANFDNYEDADQLKAKLLLNGSDHISIVKTIIGKHTAYKVMIGPFRSRSEAAKIHQQLQENAINSTLVTE